MTGGLDLGSRNDIDNGQAYDWGRVSADYAKYRDIYPEEFYDRIVGEGLCLAGQNVLDLGTGTGVLPRHLYKHGARFVGTDIAENQIAEARRLSAELGMDIGYLVSPAEALDFPDGSFDVVLACMCFFYFDRSIMLPKIQRMLKDGGRFCTLYMNWMPDSLGIAAGSEALVLKYNPLWTGHGMPRVPPDAPEWAKAHFDVVSETAYDVDIPFTRDSWHGRIRACRGVGASSLPADALARFEAEHRAFLGTVPESFIIPHYVTMLHLRKR
jgi:SAM-dependent methyltransferase